MNRTLLVVLVILGGIVWSTPTNAQAPERPQAAQDVPCPEYAAPFHLTATVFAGTLPVGSYTVWSCAGRDDLLEQAAVQEDAVRKDACRKYPWSCP